MKNERETVAGEPLKVFYALFISRDEMNILRKRNVLFGSHGICKEHTSYNSVHTFQDSSFNEEIKKHEKDTNNKAHI